MVSRRTFAALVGTLLVLAGCGSAGGPPPQAPSISPAATSVDGVPTVRATGTPTGTASPGAAVCRESADLGVVAVSIADFEFKPASIAAKVGQVVAFTNAGFEPHNATVEGCATRTLETGGSDGLVFTVPGEYRFGCTVHAWMTGTLTITP